MSCFFTFACWAFFWRCSKFGALCLSPALRIHWSLALKCFCWATRFNNFRWAEIADSLPFRRLSPHPTCEVCQRAVEIDGLGAI
jgi:hypothetical protein